VYRGAAYDRCEPAARHPLGASTARAGNSPADRIAASKAALGPANPPNILGPGSDLNRIAAARRAARAASAEVAGRNAVIAKCSRPGKACELALVEATVVCLLLLGTPHIVAHFFSSSSDTEVAVPSETTALPPRTTAPPITTEQSPTPGPPPTPVGRQSTVIPGASSVPFTPPLGFILPSDAPHSNTGATPAQKPESVVSFAHRMTAGIVRLQSSSRR
jgi:hypothetical protein